MSSSVKCIVAMTLIFALEVAFPKHLQVTCFSAPLQVQEKELLEAISPKFMSEKNVLCNNSDQACFSDTLTSVGPLGKC